MADPVEPEQIWGYQQIVTLQELGLQQDDILELKYDPHWKALVFRIHVRGKRHVLQTALDRLATLAQKWSEDARRGHHTQ